MCRVTVRKGLTLILGGVVFITFATFLHGALARLLLLSPAKETQLTFYGFLLGGASGACGVLVAAAGLLRSIPRRRDVSLLPVVLLLLTALGLFFLLSYLSFTGGLPTPPRPGESVTI